MSFLQFEFVEPPQDSVDTLRVNRNENRIHAKMYWVGFVDKDLGQHTLYVPSLKLISHGETVEKARVSMEDLVQKIFHDILTRDPSDLQTQLLTAGFEQHEGVNESYLRTWQETNGEVNAAENSVRYGAVVS